MRRLLAILLLLASSLPLVPPLMAATLTSQISNLPACCRRHGAHHCMAQAVENASGTHFAAPHEKCPMWPAATTVTTHANASLLSEFLFHLHQPSLESDASALPSFAGDHLRCSRHERGPPSHLA